MLTRKLVAMYRFGAGLILGAIYGSVATGGSESVIVLSVVVMVAGVVTAYIGWSSK